MNEEEKIVKQEMENLGYSVIKLNMDGLPDFLCIKNNKKVFIEVKSEYDALSVNQIIKTIDLVNKGFKIYIFVVKDKQIIKFNLQFNTIQEISLVDIGLKDMMVEQIEHNIINMRKWLNIITQLSIGGHLSKSDFEEMRNKCIKIIDDE